MKFYIAGPMHGIKDHNFPEFDRVRDMLKKWGHDVVSPADLTREQGGPLPDDKAPPGSPKYKEFLRVDLHSMLRCDAIMLLDKWYESTGATLEAMVAQQTGLIIWAMKGTTTEVMLYCENHASWRNSINEAFLKKHVPHYQIRATAPTSPAPVPLTADTMLATVDKLVSTDRQSTYGHPLDNFTNIARLWDAHLENKVDKLITDRGEKHSDYSTIEGWHLSAEDVADMLVLLKVARLTNGAHLDSSMDTAGYAKTRVMVTEERARRASDK